MKEDINIDRIKVKREANHSLREQTERSLEAVY